VGVTVEDEHELVVGVVEELDDGAAVGEDPAD
jgi:hypothetical protein